MIKSEKERSFSLQQAEMLERDAASIEAQSPPEDVHPTVWRKSAESLRYKALVIREEVVAYDTAKAGKAELSVPFEKAGELLIRARLVRGLSQAQLAEKLGLKRQQVHRYEASEYASASLRVLQEVANALEVKFDLSEHREGG